MTCQSTQNRILALPDPRQVPDPLRAHLDACPACAAWWRQAARLERLLERLPVPPAPADKKADLIDELTATWPVLRPAPLPARRPGRSAVAAALAAPGLRYAAGLAAAVLVAVGAWALLNPGKAPQQTAEVAPPQRHQLLDKVVRRDLALAQAKTATQRLEILGGLADDLSAEARGLTGLASQDELNDLARWFDRVVQGGIVRQAEQMPPHAVTPEARRVLFERLSAGLAEAGDEADRAARASSPHAQPALKTIAESARDGRAKLRAILARGGVSMSRPGVTLAVFVAAAAWAGAQGPGPAPSPADRVRMFKADRALLADLVDTGVKLGGADRPLARAESCRETARAVAVALRRAAEAGDADRVAELGGHLELLTRDGLVPALDEARQMIPAGSPDAEHLGAVRARAADDLGEVRSALPPAGAAGDTARVRDVSARLEGLQNKLAK